jgi:hypothetical protein
MLDSKLGIKKDAPKTNILLPWVWRSGKQKPVDCGKQAQAPKRVT